MNNENFKLDLDIASTPCLLDNKDNADEDNGENDEYGIVMYSWLSIILR